MLTLKVTVTSIRNSIEGWDSKKSCTQILKGENIDFLFGQSFLSDGAKFEFRE
jgi:hypothetical protein